jgi:hypothetical protein
VGTWAQSKESEQPANGWRERQLLAIAVRGHPSQQPHLQHVTILIFVASWDFAPPLTVR